MACKTEMQHLMDRVLDHEASVEEEQRFLQHMQKCQTCRLSYEQLRLATEQVSGLEVQMPPKHFTAAVMESLPD